MPNDGGEALLEAKRPKSSKRLDEHIHKGAKQIEESDSRGVIAVSLDRVLRPSMSHMRAHSRGRVHQRLGKQLNKFVDRREEKILGRMQGRGVLALLFVIRIPARVNGPFPFNISTRHLLPVADCFSRDKKRIRKLREYLERGGS